MMGAEYPSQDDIASIVVSMMDGSTVTVPGSSATPMQDVVRLMTFEHPLPLRCFYKISHGDADLHSSESVLAILFGQGGNTPQ